MTEAVQIEDATIDDVTIDDVTIVGAGPAGLAVARELGRLGVRAPLLERGRVGETWSRQYAGMHLHTRTEMASLPGLAWRGTRTPFPSAVEMTEYLRTYARYFALDVREGVHVEATAHEGGIWRLATSAGEHLTRRLVLATGIWSAPIAPPLPGSDVFRGRLLHAASYRDREELRGARVLVVGLGNTGNDVALDASSVGSPTTVSVRGGVVFVPHPGPITQHAGRLWRRLPPSVADALLRRLRHEPSVAGLRWPAGQLTDAFPVVGAALLAAAADARITIRPEVVALTEHGATFGDGSSDAFDVIVLATGYRPALDAVARHVRFDAAGRPETDDFAAVGTDGLYLVGYRYPTLETWLQQLRREAPAAARAIARHVRERP